jgi:hypothetical protein
MDPNLLRPIVSSLIRYALVTLGVTEAAGGDGVEQLAGALLTMGLVGYSIVKGVRQAKTERE